MYSMIKRIDYFKQAIVVVILVSYLKVPNEKCISSRCLLIHHREKGYILYDTGYHFEIKKKARYFWCRLATPMRR